MVSSHREKWKKKQVVCNRNLAKIELQRNSYQLAVGSKFFWKPLVKLDDEELELTKTILDEAADYISKMCIDEAFLTKLEDRRTFHIKRCFSDELFQQVFTKEPDRISIHLCLEGMRAKSETTAYENIEVLGKYSWDANLLAHPIVRDRLQEIPGTMGQTFRLPMETLSIDGLPQRPIFRCEAFFRGLVSKLFPLMKFMKLALEFSATQNRELETDYVPHYSVAPKDFEKLKKNDLDEAIHFYLPLDGDKTILCHQIWSAKGGKPNTKEVTVREGEIYFFKSNVCLSSNRENGRSNLCIKGVCSMSIQSCKFGYTPRTAMIEEELERQFFAKLESVKPSVLHVLKVTEDQKKIELMTSFSKPINF